MDPATGQPARNPRICLLTGSFHPVVGGGERHARLLCCSWASQGTAALVITRQRTRELAKRAFFEGYEIIRVGPAGFPRAGKYLMLLPALCALWRRRHDYDVIYVCGLRVLGWAGVLAQLLTGKPCVLRAESRGEWSGEFIWKSPEGRIHGFKRFVFRPLVRLRNRFMLKAKAFLAISTPIREEFEAGRIPREKTILIPNGFDPGEFYPVAPEDRLALRREFGWGEARVFMYAGKLNRGKGLEMLLGVWERYIKEYPQDRLLLVGSGKGQPLSCEDALRAFVQEHQLESSVTFTGYTDRVADYLRAADCFVFSSESEAQGLAPLEAMTCGLPVIASRIPGVMDMIRHEQDGYLVEAKHEGAWLNAMLLYASQPSIFSSLREVAQQTAVERYAITSVAQQHRSFFAGLLERA